MTLRKTFQLWNILIAILLVGLYLSNSATLFTLTYFTELIIMVTRMLQTSGTARVKIGLTAIFLMIAIGQIIFCEQFIPDHTGWRSWPIRLFAVLIIFVPMVISRYVTVGKYSEFYLPSVREAATISFAEFHSGIRRISDALKGLNSRRGKLTSDNFKELLNNFSRNDSFRYVNAGSLTEDYFTAAAATMDDPRLYVVISNTGSATSEILSVFTAKHFNHASLSFDREMETVISYNGGERVYPPGLNREMVAYFMKKKDASILVYSLPCPAKDKRLILDKIREINANGSAYNALGLVLKHSFRPNIMFCSQFVYRMLELAGVVYFTKPDGKVEPMDFIEQDFYRVLKFEYELKL